MENVQLRLLIRIVASPEEELRVRLYASSHPMQPMAVSEDSETIRRLDYR
jgi:hypothetical protein